MYPIWGCGGNYWVTHHSSVVVQRVTTVGSQWGCFWVCTVSGLLHAHTQVNYVQTEPLYPLTSVETRHGVYYQFTVQGG